MAIWLNTQRSTNLKQIGEVKVEKEYENRPTLLFHKLISFPSLFPASFSGESRLPEKIFFFAPISLRKISILTH